MDLWKYVTVSKFKYKHFNACVSEESKPVCRKSHILLSENEGEPAFKMECFYFTIFYIFLFYNDHLMEDIDFILP